MKDARKKYAEMGFKPTDQQDTRKLVVVADFRRHYTIGADRVVWVSVSR